MKELVKLMSKFAIRGGIVTLVVFLFLLATAWGQESSMLVDDLDTVHPQVDNRKPITVAAPMSFSDMYSYYGGFSGWGFGVGYGSSLYPAYSSTQPAQELSAAIQQELLEEYQRVGSYRTMLPKTGRLSGQLAVVRAEAGDRNVQASRYVLVSAYEILEEQVKGREIRPGVWTQIAGVAINKFDRWGIGGRVVDGFDQAANQSGWADSRRRVVGILYIAIVDAESGSIVEGKSQTGVGDISYTDYEALSLPGYGSTTINYKGAGGFARQLVLAALYNPSDRKAIAKKYQAGR